MFVVTSFFEDGGASSNTVLHLSGALFIVLSRCLGRMHRQHRAGVRVAFPAAEVNELLRAAELRLLLLLGASILNKLWLWRCCRSSSTSCQSSSAGARVEFTSYRRIREQGNQPPHCSKEVRVAYVSFR